MPRRMGTAIDNRSFGVSKAGYSTLKDFIPSSMWPRINQSFPEFNQVSYQSLLQEKALLSEA